MPSLIKYKQSFSSNKIVIDTNVFLSGVIFGGNPSRIISLVKKGRFNLLMSPQLEKEIFTKLKEMKVSNEDIDSLHNLLDLYGFRVIPKSEVNICRDPKDNMLLSLCDKGQADFLITGDKDLLILKSFQTTKILNPKDFLKIMKMA